MCVEMDFRTAKTRLRWDLNPGLFRSFITDKRLIYSVRAHWDLKPEPLSSFYKGCIPHTETKSISTTDTKTKSIYHHTKTKSISGSTQTISTPRTKIESTSIQTLNQTQIRPPTQTIKIISSPPLKRSRYPLYHRVHFDGPIQQSI